jgi:formamidopyrimidine-DNA glycosylase
VGKRIAIGFEGDHWLVLHLMIAGRLHWVPPTAPKKGRAALAYFVFDSGTLTLTEAGTKRRASLYVFSSSEQLANTDPGGLEVLDASLEEFSARLRAENHTLKRSLTDPRTFSGVGNAYSDEILHRAHLSPVALTQKLTPEAIRRLYEATREVMTEWTGRLREEARESFPEKVTAFRPEMAVHGRFGKPCPVCGTTVQRIRYAENETNYCPRCQTEGRILADRSLSRLLKDDWPRTVEELEA